MSVKTTDKLALEIADILKQIKQVEHENQVLKAEVQRIRSLLLQAEKKTKAPLVRG